MFPLMIAATRARVALLVAGLAWFFGLDAPAVTRVAIGLIVLAALVMDGFVDEQRYRRGPVPSQRDRHTTAA